MLLRGDQGRLQMSKGTGQGRGPAGGKGPVFWVFFIAILGAEQAIWFAALNHSDQTSRVLTLLPGRGCDRCWEWKQRLVFGEFNVEGSLRPPALA